MQIDFTISFSDTEWICYNDNFHYQGSNLDAIDDEVEKHLKLKYPNQNIKVNMYFDFDRFPLWHRQYMPHYFNRTLNFSTY